MRDIICIIAGSRWATKDQTYTGIALCPWANRIAVVVSGECPPRFHQELKQMTSADYWGAQWAGENAILVDPHPARYDLYDMYKAPVIRNSEMVNAADALLLVWDGKTKGSKDVRTKALRRGLLFFEYDWSQEAEPCI